MTNQNLDIVQLIEKSPLTRLSKDYQSRLLTKIKTAFTNNEQQLFVTSFYCYLNYSKDDFIISLESVWKWCGFTRQDNAKVVLKKHFVIDIDYKIVLLRLQENLKGGRPKEDILMTIGTFKRFCLKANTKKADEIHNYYIKLEELMHDTINEESNELRLQLQIKDNKLEEKREQLKLKDNQLKKTIEQFENKPETEGFYKESGYIYIIKDVEKNCRYKIGKTNKLSHRISCLNVGSSDCSLIIDRYFKTIDMVSAEKIIHTVLNPYKIKKRSEWFFFIDSELNLAINTIEKCIEFSESFRQDQRFEEIYENKNLEIINNEENLDDNEKITNYKGIFWDKARKKWRAELTKNYKSYFLGYYNNEIDGAKAYNDYAIYNNDNENEKTNYTLNDIKDYIPNPRNIPEENNNLKLEKKFSKYIGVTYDSSRNHYSVSMRFKRKHINISNNNSSELECAKIYNQQALYYNNHYDTDYKLNDIPDFTTIEKDIYKELQYTHIDIKSSQYRGVVKRKNGKFISQLIFNKKPIRLGTFENELDAAKAYNEKAKELNVKHNKNYKINIDI